MLPYTRIVKLFTLQTVSIKLSFASPLAKVLKPVIFSFNHFLGGDMKRISTLEKKRNSKSYKVALMVGMAFNNQMNNRHW